MASLGRVHIHVDTAAAERDLARLREKLDQLRVPQKYPWIAVALVGWALFAAEHLWRILSVTLCP